jgi:hypothetical protein
MQEMFNYPQFRKYPHERTYFKIISKDEWEEIQIMGAKHSIHKFKATILPDRNYIYDLTFDYENNWVEIKEEEYENIKKKVTVL